MVIRFPLLSLVAVSLLITSVVSANAQSASVTLSVGAVVAPRGCVASTRLDSQSGPEAVVRCFGPAITAHSTPAVTVLSDGLAGPASIDGPRVTVAY